MGVVVGGGDLRVLNSSGVVGGGGAAPRTQEYKRPPAPRAAATGHFISGGHCISGGPFISGGHFISGLLRERLQLVIA